MKNVLAIILFLSVVLSMAAINGLIAGEINLKPSIGLDALPSDDEEICEVQFVIHGGTFNTMGIYRNMSIPDFTLYTLDGEAVNARALLETGKPLVIMLGSYTCPVFRRKLPIFNQIYEKYKGEVNFLMVNIIEAHPEVDINKYTPPPGREWVTDANIEDDILYRQPTTYGERKAIVYDMLDDLDIPMPLVIDGPCNSFWTTFGPAPNSAYLINPDGTVYTKAPWFEKAGYDLDFEINSLLTGVPPDSLPAEPNSIFRLTLYDRSIKAGYTDQTVIIEGRLDNIFAMPIWVDLDRIVEDLPDGWTSAMHTEICQLPEIPYYELYMKGMDTCYFALNVYTDANPGSGDVTLTLTNRSNPDNKYYMQFRVTAETSDIPEELFAEEEINVYPNPFAATTNINFTIDEPGFLSISIYDVYGNLSESFVDKYFEEGEHNVLFNGASLSNGVYFCRLRSNGKVSTIRLNVAK